MKAVENELQECSREYVFDCLHFSLLVRCVMTGVRRATEADILMMFDLVECAREDFDVLPVGVPVSAVDAVFARYTVYAGEDCPAGLVWLRVGADGVVVPCRLLRWVQRELLILRECAVSRCAGTPFTTI